MSEDMEVLDDSPAHVLHYRHPSQNAIVELKRRAICLIIFYLVILSGLIVVTLYTEHVDLLLNKPELRTLGFMSIASLSLYFVPIISNIIKLCTLTR